MVGGVSFAEREYSQTEIETGARLYVANCINCHGSDGAQIPGVDLGHGRFKRASTDQDLIQIIRNGIRGTGMPPQILPEGQVSDIVAYLRSLAAAPSGKLPSGGDPARGKAVFEGNGECLHCHRVRDKGSRMGPDLSEIGSLRRPVDLERSILDPDENILPEHRFFRAVTREGSVVTGRILNQDTFTVQLMDAHERLLSFSRASLREFTSVNSPMPSYRGKLDSQELPDLVSYLVSLRGR
jgi:putative heme-binding domain-containing protein